MAGSSERFWRSVALLIIGTVFGRSLDYWVTFVRVVSNIDAKLVSLSALQDILEIDVAFVNSGNHEGALVAADVIFPTSEGAYTVPAPREWTVTSGALPVVLEPGQIRLTRFKGKVDLESMFHNAEVGEGWAGKTTAIGKPAAEVALRVRALDFKGRAFESRWKICTVSRDQRGGGLRWKEGDRRISVFDERYLAERSWFGFPSLPAGTPLPTPNADQPLPVELTPSPD